MVAARINQGLRCQLCGGEVAKISEGQYSPHCDYHLFHLSCMVDSVDGSTNWSQPKKKSNKLKIKAHYGLDRECVVCGKKRSKVVH